MLLRMKEDLLRSIQKAISQQKSARDLEGNTGDDSDIASIETERDYQYLMGTRDREKLLKINEALIRLEKGEYGICQECGEPIGIKRLKAMPFALLCVRCQEEEEEVEKIIREQELEEDERQYLELLSEEGLLEGGSEEEGEEGSGYL
jgi:DnaK suppressor protein